MAAVFSDGGCPAFREPACCLGRPQTEDVVDLAFWLGAFSPRTQADSRSWKLEQSPRRVPYSPYVVLVHGTPNTSRLCKHPRQLPPRHQPRRQMLQDFVQVAIHVYIQSYYTTRSSCCLSLHELESNTSFPLILNTSNPPNNKYPLNKRAFILGLCFL